MGKRELVLIAAFVLVGVVIYQVTAPPLAPGQEGFSFGRMIQNVRRNMQGGRTQAAVESSRTEAVGADIAELRLDSTVVGDLVVVGEDRQDAVLTLKASSNGTDEADAKRLAGLVSLQVRRSAAGLAVSIEYPPEGRQQGGLVARIPKRLTVRVEARSGRLEISDVAGAIVRGNRGETVVKNVTGDADLSQRGGQLRLAHAGSLRLNLINASAEIADVGGVASVDASGGKLQLTGIVGPLDLKSRNSDVRLTGAPALKAPLRLDMQAGELDIEGLRTEARIDGRNTEMRVTMDKAAPLTIYNSGENIVLVPPPGGYALDAIATDGGFTSEEPAIKTTGDDRERRFTGPVRGGGPTLTLRATRGRIEIRKSTATAK
jgi:hypothetical protein